MTPLPGHEVVEQGLADLEAGRRTPEAFAVLEARPRLTRLGFTVPESDVERPSHALYRALAEEDPATAHSRHHAMLRRLVSFCRAAGRAR